ncbi:MAG: RsmD family RNA methyltransferase, partial [Flavobacteriales bacterium]
TTDFAREGIMNMLQHEVEWNGLRVLDLFAGTGALGLECLSRGAQHATAVDMSPLHTRCIRENFVAFGFHDSKAICSDAFKFIQKCTESFDLIVADPPYEMKELSSLPDKIFQSSLLRENGLLVLEHHYKINFESHAHFHRSRVFSNVAFSFFRRPNQEI